MTVMKDNVLSHRQGRAGFITLNRPKALNALTLPIVRGVHMALQVHQADPQVEVIVIRSSSEKAFCAGGDKRLIRELCLAGRHHEAMQFFEEEYTLNLAIASCTKPYVAWLDGIAMGGGLGLSVQAGIASSPSAACSRCQKRRSDSSLMSGRPISCRGCRTAPGGGWA